MKLQRLEHDFSICKVNDLSAFDLHQEFCFLSKTDEESSLVCITRNVPDNAVAREDGWKAFRVQGMLDFSLVGVLSRIAGLLARSSVSIFAVSTYNTDYVFVKTEQWERALQALTADGFQIL